MTRLILAVAILATATLTAPAASAQDGPPLEDCAALHPGPTPTLGAEPARPTPWDQLSEREQQAYYTAVQQHHQAHAAAVEQHRIDMLAVTDCEARNATAQYVWDNHRDQQPAYAATTPAQPDPPADTPTPVVEGLDAATAADTAEPWTFPAWVLLPTAPVV